MQFPDFDPVLVSFGPFQIRWYALAYIAGILLGWLYARALIRNERLWGGPAPLTPVDFDDFVLWVTLGIILGGRIGYVLFYNPAHFLARQPRHLLDRFELLALDHVEVAQDALGLMAQHGVELAPHALGDTGRVVHQPRRLIEESVAGLGHRRLQCLIELHKQWR